MSEREDLVERPYEGRPRTRMPRSSVDLEATSPQHPPAPAASSVKLVAAVTAILVLAGFVHGQDISASGGWTETINALDLVSGAGTDLTDTYESGSGATVVSITTGTSWRVDVSRSDNVWHADFTLHVQRTSDGTGVGSISGGEAYQGITATDTEFFSGSQDRTGIDLQYKLTGMSVKAGPQTYNTTVTFTVV